MKSTEELIKFYEEELKRQKEKFKEKLDEIIEKAEESVKKQIIIEQSTPNRILSKIKDLLGIETVDYTSIIEDLTKTIHELKKENKVLEEKYNFMRAKEIKKNFIESIKYPELKESIKELLEKASNLKELEVLIENANKEIERYEKKLIVESVKSKNSGEEIKEEKIEPFLEKLKILSGD